MQFRKTHCRSDVAYCGLIAIWAVCIAIASAQDSPQEPATAPEQELALLKPLSWSETVDAATKAFNEGKYDQSAELAQKALDLTEQDSELDEQLAQTRMIRSLDWLGLALQKTGDYADAKEALMRSLALRRRLMAPSNPALADSLNKLGDVLRDIGYPDDAQKCYAEAADIFEAQQRKSRLDAVDAEAEDIARKSGKEVELIPRANDLDSWKLPPAVRDIKLMALVAGLIIIGMLIYGGFYLADFQWKRLRKAGMTAFLEGELEDAEKYHLSACRIAGFLGKNDLRLAQSLSNLGILHIFQGRREEAEPLLKKSLEISELKLSRSSLDLAAAMTQYAELLESLDRAEEAEPLRIRAGEIKDKYR